MPARRRTLAPALALWNLAPAAGMSRAQGGREGILFPVTPWHRECAMPVLSCLGWGVGR
jgi:hypothetical protein